MDLYYIIMDKLFTNINVVTINIDIHKTKNYKQMKRKDPRLLNECKDKVIPILQALSSDTPPENDAFENFIKATDFYTKLTEEYNRTILIAENLHRQIVEHEKLIKDIKERAKAAIILQYGKSSLLFRNYNQSSEYKKVQRRNQLKEKKMKGL